MNIGDAHIYSSHDKNVLNYLDGYWTASTSDVKSSIVGQGIYDFEVVIEGYAPDNVVNFELKI